MNNDAVTWIQPLFDSRPLSRVSPGRHQIFILPPPTTIFSGAGDGDGQCLEMSLREPAWRAPSRPCPFYQRGNCIFAAKCNFLHTIPQSRYGVEQNVKTLHKLKESLDYDAPPPILRVDSPASIRSPPHDPQMQRLLSALTDVIGDAEGDELEDEETLTEPDEPDSWSSGLPTLVHGADATFFARVNDTMAELMQLTDADDDNGNDDIPSPAHDDNDNTLELPEDPAKEYPDTPLIHTTEGSPEAQYVEMPPPGLPENHDDLLSPVDLSSSLQLNNFGSFSLEEDTMSIDSGFEEAWKPPPTLGSTFDLLRSPFGSPSSRLHSPHIGALLTPASPLKPLEQPSSLEDDLDSPSDRISAPVVVEEDRESPASESKSTPASTTSLAYMLSPEPIQAGNGRYDSEADISGIIDDDESFSHTSVWEPATVETAIYVGANSQGPVATEVAQELPPQDVELLDEESTERATLETAGHAGTNNEGPFAAGVEQGARHQDTQPLGEAEEDLSDWDDDEVQSSVHDTMSSDALNEELLQSAPSPPLNTGEVPDTQDGLAVIETETEPELEIEVEDKVIDLDGTPSQPQEEWAEQVTPHMPTTSTVPAPTSPESQPSLERQALVEASFSSPLERGFDSPERPIPVETSLSSPPEPELNLPQEYLSHAASLRSSPPEDFDSPGPPIPADPSLSSPPGLDFDTLSTQPSYVSEDDATALHDYLQSEPEDEDDTAMQDSDTLHSLYDIYTDANEEGSPRPYSPAASLKIQSPAEPPQPLHRNVGASPKPRPLLPSLAMLSPAQSGRPLRERVFTPPPSASQLRRSQTLSTASSSPVTSMDSTSKGRESPASVASSSKTSHHNIGEEVEGQEASKKVPFGFRSQRHSARPSLVLNQGRSLSRLGRSPIDSDSEDKVSTPPPSSACSTGALRPLRLSVLLNNQSNSIQSLSNANIHPHSATASLSSVPSRNSLLDSHSLPSAPATANPYHFSDSSAHILDSTSRPQRSPSLLTDDLQHLATFGSPLSAPAAAQPHPSWPSAPPLVSHLQEFRSASRPSEPIYEQEHEGEGDEDSIDDTYQQDSRDEPIQRAILDSPQHHRPPHPHSHTHTHSSPHVPHHVPPLQPRTAPASRSESVAREPIHSIATPKPTLMFAIASDDVKEVRRVLENGEANPNDTVGPQSALQFALTNDQLTNKLDIVKTLLAFGADPSKLKAQPGVGNGSRSGSRAGNRRELEEGGNGEKKGEQGSSGEGGSGEAGAQEDVAKTLMDEMDPATRYYVQRADAAHTRKTSKLIHQSFFRPLTRVRYDLVGQDRALEELFKLLSIHSRQISAAPVVVMFSGPSGHGKSLLARKFGSLLDVPTHTVNMVTVRSQDDLWESYSINIHEEPTNCTLAEFLVNNEGKRCVVVLDEIEKVDNEKVLWSLLMPWESGRCSFEAKSRHVDTRNVVWLCTSNIGHDLVFDHWAAREKQEEILSREEFLELVALLRPTVSERLGASVLSRITSVLPFVPFTTEEKRAVCAEAVYQLGGEDALALSRDTVDELIESSLRQYIPEEGARSLHRAVSNQLLDVI